MKGGFVAAWFRRTGKDARGFVSRVDPRRDEVGHLEILDVEEQRVSTSKSLKITQKLAQLLSIMKPGETDIAARSISQTGLGMVVAASHRSLLHTTLSTLTGARSVKRVLRKVHSC